MFLGLPDPDPLVRGMDRILLSSWKTTSKKKLDSYYFMTLFVDFFSLKSDVNVPLKSKKQIKWGKKN
jgi:hypothetical protein